MTSKMSAIEFRTKLETMMLLVVSLIAGVILGAAAEGSQDCEAITEPGVMFFDVRLPRTAVPGTRTSYVCQAQPIPITSQDDYHAVAFEPLVDNKDLVHHMLMFGCGETYDNSMQLAQARTPHLCGASDNACRFFLVQWSMGVEGQICSPPDAGVRFGLRSISRLSLQIHWNNGNSTEGRTDSSGFRVYYTKRLRKYDVANVQIGQNDLEIPPGQGHYPQTGGCSSECTSQWLQQPIFLTRAHIHMHYIGDGGLLELVRDGRVVEEIVRDRWYDYTRPPAHVLDQPVRVLPGDELRLTCIYNTRDGEKQRNRTIYWGEGSDGEMCYAFITYYPKVENFNQCIKFIDYDICSESGFASFGDCVYPGFLRAFEMGMAAAILDQCGNADSTNTNTYTNSNPRDAIQTGRLCSDACADAIQEVTGHPCMQGRLGKTLRRTQLPELVDWPNVKQIIEQAESLCPSQQHQYM
ncbi:hypothetical protein EGW08_019663 [Elysia chlorotica]|uniref:Peptidylglycine monooxygenase n=1 Tax=Elysia chlorotica TaxID=188477 RepID=A0A3S0ZPZ1_ELYCH|nr:hypothetical protein EGW08_019663 [Elysia chlorotica]